MTHLRQRVSEFMVRVHRIPRELADQQVAEMDDAELRFRLERYSGDAGKQQDEGQSA